MKWIIESAAVIAVVPAKKATLANSTTSYFLGAIIALFIMGYLVYTLLRPEKF